MDLWIVYDYEEGFICCLDDYYEALSYYEDYVLLNMDRIEEFDGNEKVVLAKVSKMFYSSEIEKVDEEGRKLFDWRTWEEGCK